MRTGPVHRARKLHLHHRLVPARSYTYYPAGNLLTDSYRHIFQSTMGRANLPFTLMKDIQGAPYRESYLYNTADQRIYKEEDRYAQGSEVSQVVTSEFHLLDAGGHDLGVLDLNTGKWEWYIFGAQRFAKLTPADDQQPDFVSTDLSGLAPEPKPGEVELENLLNCLGSLVGNTQLYPLTLMRYKTGENEPVKYDEQSVFNAIPASAQATIIPVDHPLSFRSGKDRLTLSTDPRSSYSIDALMKMAMQRNGPISFPFAYTYPANTALNKVTYYEHDHLGNLRVAFTPVVDCSNPTGTEPDPGLNHPNSSFTLEHVVDYFPYGKILRQYVNSGGPERYLSTQHERDQETGLDYRGARYYDSDVARFLSLDPKAADYASWSPYNYVMGNPISLIDPDGKACNCPNPPCGRGYAPLLAPMMPGVGLAEHVLPLISNVRPVTSLREYGDNVSRISDNVQMSSLAFAPANPVVAEAVSGAAGLTSVIGTMFQAAADVKDGKPSTAALRVGLLITFNRFGEAFNKNVMKTELPGKQKVGLIISNELILEKADKTAFETVEKLIGTTENSGSSSPSTSSSTAPATPAPVLPMRTTGTDQAPY